MTMMINGKTIFNCDLEALEWMKTHKPRDKRGWTVKTLRSAMLRDCKVLDPDASLGRLADAELLWEQVGDREIFYGTEEPDWLTVLRRRQNRNDIEREAKLRDGGFSG